MSFWADRITATPVLSFRYTQGGTGRVARQPLLAGFQDSFDQL